jgi:hypothetical protein
MYKMTGKRGPTTHYENGDEKIIVKFAWLPICRPNINGIWQIKWLELVKIKQQYWDGKWYNAYFVELFLRRFDYVYE